MVVLLSMAQAIRPRCRRSAPASIVPHASAATDRGQVGGRPSLLWFGDLASAEPLTPSPNNCRRLDVCLWSYRWVGLGDCG